MLAAVLHNRPGCSRYLVNPVCVRVNDVPKTESVCRRTSKHILAEQNSAFGSTGQGIHYAWHPGASR